MTEYGKALECAKQVLHLRDKEDWQTLEYGGAQIPVSEALLQAEEMLREAEGLLMHCNEWHGKDGNNLEWLAKRKELVSKGNK